MSTNSTLMDTHPLAVCAQWPYQLMTAFPSAVIEDETKSLADAGLLAAVVIQKKV